MESSLCLHSVLHAQHFLTNNVIQSQHRESKVRVAIKAQFLSKNGSCRVTVILTIALSWSKIWVLNMLVFKRVKNAMEATICMTLPVQ